MLKSLLIFIVIILLALPAAAQEPDLIPEPELLLLTEAVSYEGNFDYSRIGDLYGFWASAGDQITITMQPTQDSVLDPFLVLMSVSGQVLAFHDDLGTGGTLDVTAQITDFEIPADGAYLVLATRPLYLLNEAGSEFFEGYVITLEGSTPPANQGAFGLISRPIRVGETYEGATSAENPIQFFYVESLEDTSYIDVTVRSTTFDPVLFSFFPDGLGARYNDDVDINRDTTAYGYALYIPGGEAYLLMVTGYNFPLAAAEGWDEYGAFSVTVEESAE